MIHNPPLDRAMADTSVVQVELKVDQIRLGYIPVQVGFKKNFRHRAGFSSKIFP